METTENNRKQQRKKNSNKSMLIMANNILLVIVTSAIILLFMPRNYSFNYQYEVGKPWSYSQLIAKFKFPIYKDTAVVQRERDTIAKSFQPYFLMNEDKLKEAMEKLESINTSKINISNDKITRYKRHIAEQLANVYDKLVMSSTDYNMLVEKGTQVIRVIDKNTAKPVPLDNVFSVKSAYQHIMDADTINFSRVVLSQFNLQELISANLSYDKKKTDAELKEAMASVPAAIGVVQSGQKIIDRGEIVTAQIYNILESFKKESEKHMETERRVPYIFIGQAVLVVLIVLLLVTYLNIFRKNYVEKFRSCIFPFALLVIFCVIAELMMSNKILHVYILPFALVPIFIRIFMDSRTAFIFHTGMILIISLFLHNQYEFVFLQIVVGIAVIQNMRELTQRSQTIYTAMFVTILYIICFEAFQLVHEADINKVDHSKNILFVINGIFLLFTYPLLWLIEKTFGYTSDVTFVELSNTNNKLLRKLSEKAPGTFQHSMQVASLATDVVKEIGGRTQLVRTGALYHDIGKMENPAYFTENQLAGVSPFEGMEPQDSARIIIRHVTDGMKLAKANNLPKEIKEFIMTHHGHGKARYFYNTYKNLHPNEQIDEEPFTYPGPNPFTKEQAVLMMSDAIEAASRSMKEFTEESIGKFVDRIIDGQVGEGFFLECPITFKEIAAAKKVFKEKLLTIYHSRITYPELNEKSKKNIEKHLDEEGKAASAAFKALDDSKDTAKDTANPISDSPKESAAQQPSSMQEKKDSAEETAIDENPSTLPSVEKDIVNSTEINKEKESTLTEALKESSNATSGKSDNAEDVSDSNVSHIKW